MPDVLTEPVAPKAGGGGIDRGEEGFGEFGGGGPSGEFGLDSARLGLWILLGMITMLFAAFTSAYIVRSAGTDWAPLTAPPVLWVNTVLLLVSSATIEMGRRAFTNWRPIAFRKWMVLTSILGLSFIAGQFLGWKQLAEAGFYLQSNPHSSFFYVLSGVHAVHLLSGVGALGYVVVQALRYRLTPGESRAPELAATYWHFLGGLWLYLLVVLFVI